MNLRKAVILAALILLGSFFATAQNKRESSGLTESDYGNYPHWFDMMLDYETNFFETQKAFYTYWADRQPSKGTGYTVFKRWEWYWENRINPDGTFPEPGKIYREVSKYFVEHPVSERLKSGAPQWRELGPKTRVNYGGYNGVGRINAIAFHPTDTATIYIGAPSGGFWITNDGGQSWRTTTDALPTIGVSAILSQYDHPEVILIGTGDRDGGSDQGIGTFKSYDGGETWMMSNEGIGNITVGMFAQHEVNPNIILAAANGGIFKTSDFGDSWEKKSENAANYRDIKFKPADMSVAYATSNTGFYRSEDGGETWNPIGKDEGLTAPGRKVIGVTPANDSLVYIVAGGGPFQGCFLSRDFGQTFTLQSDEPNILGYSPTGDDDKSQAGYDLMIHIDVNNPDIVHVGGVNTWKSRDAGKTWTITGHWYGADGINEVHADQHTFDYNPVSNTLYAGNDGGIYFTTDQGGSWTEISEGLGIGQMYKLGVSNTDPNKTVAGFQDNGTATRMGELWYSTGGGDGMECAVDPYDAKYSYTTLYYGDITRRIDNTSGRKIAGEDTNGINEAGAWVTPFCIHEENPNIMMVGYKNIWMSQNIKSQGSIFWRKISNNLGGANDVNCRVVEHSPADFDVFYVARDDQKVFRTDNLMDNNVIWSEITSRKPRPGMPTDIECHPYQPSTVYMSIGINIYKSVNKGVSWEDISNGLPEININTIVFDKTSIEGLYIGTDAGVYYRDAGMDEWVLHGTGLPLSVEVTDVEIYADRISRELSVLRASTYGRGLWEIGLAPTSGNLSPNLLHAVAGENIVVLEWQSPFYVDYLSDYSVYRNGERIAKVRGNSYLDRDVINETTYHFYITANYATGHESGPSNTAQGTPISEIELPYNQDFERGTGGWKAKFNFEGWEYGTTEELGIQGNDGSFFGINSGSAGAGIHVTDYLTTPAIDLSSFTGRTISLKFSYALRSYRNYDKLSVVYRTSLSGDWVNLKKLSDSGTNSWKWVDDEIDLPVEALVEEFQLAFFYDDSNEHAWGAGIDNVELFHNTTAVHLIENDTDIKVYPNPSKGEFDIIIKGLDQLDIQVLVYDVSGRIVFEKNIENIETNHHERINLTNRDKGIYQVIIRSGQREFKTKITVQ